MILTVTPNACVDKTYRVEGFALDRVNRPTLTHTVAGGKGINVARVYQTLGGQAVVTGFLGGNQGRIVSDALKSENIENACVHIPGETRLCMAIIDPTTGTQTELNERGPEVSADSVRVLVRQVEALLTQEAFAFVVCSGSLPPGVPATLYADIIARTKARGVRCVLDASGPALRAGVEAKPWMVKPNLVELESLLGTSLPDTNAFLQAMETVQAGGVDVVAATRGGEGAYLLVGGERWQAVPPRIEFVSAVASGDSFMGAFLWAWQHGAHPGDSETALRLATGAGAANAAVIGAGFCTRQSIFALANRAEVRRV